MHDFTKTMVDLGASTSLSAEEAATAVEAWLGGANDPVTTVEAGERP